MVTGNCQSLLKSVIMPVTENKYESMAMYSLLYFQFLSTLFYNDVSLQTCTLFHSAPLDSISLDSTSLDLTQLHSSLRCSTLMCIAHYSVLNKNRPNRIQICPEMQANVKHALYDISITVSSFLKSHQNQELAHNSVKCEVIWK